MTYGERRSSSTHSYWRNSMVEANVMPPALFPPGKQTPSTEEVRAELTPEPTPPLWGTCSSPGIWALSHYINWANPAEKEASQNKSGKCGPILSFQICLVGCTAIESIPTFRETCCYRKHSTSTFKTQGYDALLSDMWIQTLRSNISDRRTPWSPLDGYHRLRNIAPLFFLGQLWRGVIS
jgi:hypothetical protein